MLNVNKLNYSWLVVVVNYIVFVGKFVMKFKKIFKLKKIKNKMNFCKLN